MIQAKILIGLWLGLFLSFFLGAPKPNIFVLKKENFKPIVLILLLETHFLRQNHSRNLAKHILTQESTS